MEDQDGVVQAMVEVDGAHKPVTREEEKEEEEEEVEEAVGQAEVEEAVVDAAT